MTDLTTSQTAQQLALNNELFVKQLDAALMNAHLPPNILREMILDVNKALECDEQCQEKRLIDELKTNWTNAKNIAIKSEDNREAARAKYFHAVKGADYYEKNILTPEFQNQINKQVNTFNQELAKVKVTNSATLDAYSAAFIALKRIKELYAITLKENKQLKQKIDNKKNGIPSTVRLHPRRFWSWTQDIRLRVDIGSSSSFCIILITLLSFTLQI